MKIAEYYDRMAASYDDSFGADSIWDIPFQVSCTLIEPYLPKPPAAIVDAGGGTGKWAIPLARRGFSVSLVDISRAMLEVAKTKATAEGLEGRVTVRQGDIRGLEYPTDEFDVVLGMGDPISYCGAPNVAIAELVRVAKKGGLIVCSVDSRTGYFKTFRDSFDVDLERIASFIETGNTIGAEGFPVHAFTAEELENSFAHSGASKLKIWRIPSIMFLWSEQALLGQLRDPHFRERLISEELRFVAQGVTLGPHHLYGLFEKTRTRPSGQ